MRISLNWLREFVPFQMPVEEVAERLTMVGLEVESIERLGEKFDGFLVGKVLSVDRHPNANKLTVCTVNVGQENLQIVCGAPNVAKGQTVPVGLVGAIVPRTLHGVSNEQLLLSKVSIRGIESHGMICSAYELGIGEDRDGILVLDENVNPGTSLAKYLGLDDVVFEIGITPNRPDCLSHLGIAREVAAIVGAKLRIPKSSMKECSPRASRAVRVQIIDQTGCLRYTARVLRGVTISPSPKWLQDRLTAVGIRPINNVVDATNYVLMELGHPLHAFDLDLFQTKAIVVRNASDGEEVITLDGKQRRLRNDTLLICDGERPVAIAGVMGAANTEVSTSTTNLLIESAYFDPRSIRRTSKFLGLSTEASQRFERGADPNTTSTAATRVAALIQQLTGGEILEGEVDVYPKKIRSRQISLRYDRVNSILGTELSGALIGRLLEKIGITTKSQTTKKSIKATFEVPTFRPDLEREIDLVEEIGRVYGYDNIETKKVALIELAEQPSEVSNETILRNLLMGRGFREIISNSLLKKSTEKLFSHDRLVEVPNPISEDLCIMRPSLLPGMLESIQHNVARGNKNLRFFEIGHCFEKSQLKDGSTLEGYLENTRILIGMTGSAYPFDWASEKRQTDILDLKGEVEALVQKIFLDKVDFISYPTTNTLTEFTIDIEINNTYGGYIGKVKSEALNLFEIEQDVFIAELRLDVLRSSNRRRSETEPLPRFPSVERDLAFIIDENVKADSMVSEIRSSAGELLIDVVQFDVYRGKSIPEGKKSYAFRLRFQSLERTLTESEIELLIKGIVSSVTKQFQAQLRSL